MRDRLRKLQRLRELGIDPYCQEFRQDRDIGELVAGYGGLGSSELEASSDRFSVAGRVMAKRDFGKVTFLDLQDRTGKIQCFLHHPSLDDSEREMAACLDIGDFLGVCGGLFRTRTGELTIRVETYRFLGKALRPLPEKWHGIRDIESRYRQRYLDLIMNPRTREIFRMRTRIVQGIREFFDHRGFQEVETPMMQVLAGGADARPFVTHHNALDMDLYLRIAPELYLKRLVIGGLERVYEINRNFRNEGISTQHNPEFTMLEFYQAYAGFEEFMTLTEELLFHLVQKLGMDDRIRFQGETIALSRPWRRLRFIEALEQIGGIPEECLSDEARLRSLAAERGVELSGHRTIGKILAKLFDVLVEPHLFQPTFVTHYPVEISPLSRRNPQDPHLVDRFELFIGGREIANAFSELTDPEDQRMRFQQQQAQRDLGDEEAHPIDEDFLRALEHGMPPAAGEGVGVDRLVMLLTDSASIRDVILFPHLRPEE